MLRGVVAWERLRCLLHASVTARHMLLHASAYILLHLVECHHTATIAGRVHMRYFDIDNYLTTFDPLWTPEWLVLRLISHLMHSL